MAFAVIDRGIGMAPDDIPVALTPFQQVDIGLRRKYEGTGLGLPIAKQLMELHGGSLTIDSAQGVGTTVTVTLPAARVINIENGALPSRIDNETMIAAITTAPSTAKTPVTL